MNTLRGTVLFWRQRPLHPHCPLRGPKSRPSAASRVVPSSANLHARVVPPLRLTGGHRRPTCVSFWGLRPEKSRPRPNRPRWPGLLRGTVWVAPVGVTRYVHTAAFLRQPGMHLLQLHAVSAHSKRRYDTGRLAAWGSVGVMWVINKKCGRRMQI